LYPRQLPKAIDPLYVLGEGLKLDFGSDAMSHLAVVSMMNRDKHPRQVRTLSQILGQVRVDGPNARLTRA
jgi:hypothetical protein